MDAKKITITNFKSAIDITISQEELSSLIWAVLLQTDKDWKNKRITDAYKNLLKDLEKIADQESDAAGDLLDEIKTKRKSSKRLKMCNCKTNYQVSKDNSKVRCRKCGS